MKKFYFMFIFLLINSNSQIIENPKLLVKSKYPHVLYSNDEYYYLITVGKSLKINKESGIMEATNDNNEIKEYCIRYTDNSNNNFLFCSDRYYSIIYTPFITFQEHIITIEQETATGSITNNNNGIIFHRYKYNTIMFLTNFKNQKKLEKQNTIERLSCKYIEREIFICAYIINSKLEAHCILYSSDSTQNDLIKYEYSIIINYISSVSLYDTDKYNIKILCRKKNEELFCKFSKIIINEEAQGCSYEFFDSEDIFFQTASYFSEKNCYFTIFNNEYLFCCGITSYIHCYRIDINSYTIIKSFKISMPGSNSYLTIKINNDCVTLFFMNALNNKDLVYEYYICLPICHNKEYTIFNSLNEYKSEGEKEKLSNLFIIKTNKYYFEIINNPDDFGYFILYDNQINAKNLISNNDYILDFIVTNQDNIDIVTKVVDYKVSVEDEEAYSQECQITLNFKVCYHSCQDCSQGLCNSNADHHYCLTCKDNYYFSPENNNNCYSIEEKKINWYFDSTNSQFGICNEKCSCSCKGPTILDCLSCSNDNLENNYEIINLDLSFIEFKNLTKNEIASYIDLSRVFSGTNFLATIISSDNLDPKEQIKKGLSAVDLGI